MYGVCEKCSCHDLRLWVIWLSTLLLWWQSHWGWYSRYKMSFCYLCITIVHLPTALKPRVLCQIICKNIRDFDEYRHSEIRYHRMHVHTLISVYIKFPCFENYTLYFFYILHTRLSIDLPICITMAVNKTTTIHCYRAVVLYCLVHYAITMPLSPCRVIWRHCLWKWFRGLYMEAVPASFILYRAN